MIPKKEIRKTAFRLELSLKTCPTLGVVLAANGKRINLSNKKNKTPCKSNQ